MSKKVELFLLLICSQFLPQFKMFHMVLNTAKEIEMQLQQQIKSWNNCSSSNSDAEISAVAEF